MKAAAGQRRRRWLALLPAAKTTRPGGDGPAWDRVLGADPVLADARAAVRDAVVAAACEASDAAWEAIVDGGGDLAAQARAVARSLGGAPTRPAGQRYAGPVAERLDASSLSPRGRRHVAVVTATAGPVLVDEPVPDERLPIGSRLEPLGVLAGYWRPVVCAWLETKVTRGGVIYDLLGGEYARAVDVPAGRRRIEVRFERDDGRAAPSATAKQLRGLVARHLAAEPSVAADPSIALSGFDAEVAGDRWHGPADLTDARLTLRLT